MPPTAGTAAQIHHTTGIAATTIHTYARQGAITRTGWTVTKAGHLCPVYDALDVLRVAAARAQARHRAPRHTTLRTLRSPAM